MFKIKAKGNTGLKKQRARRIFSSSGCAGACLGFPDRVSFEAGKLKKTVSSATAGSAMIMAALGAGTGILSASAALALPTGGQVVAGSAAICQAGAAMQITQSTDRAIINWNGYNIDVNELVKYIQPGVSSVILNRVTGADPSSILGQLAANGRVFIVNPNGVLFGASSKVDVAGLLATTFDIKDSDFIQGNFSFSQGPLKASSYVINQGQIKVADNGFVFLVAPAVSNQGLIVANLGKVVLASGSAFTVDFFGDGLVKYQVSGAAAQEVTGPDGKPLSSAVSNSGTIKADGGTVLLSVDAANELLSSVVNNSGIIEATSLGTQNGQIVLSGGSQGVVADSGTLDASGKQTGQTGGAVELTGEEIGLFGGARIDVSGDSGGGDVFIGGGPHGTSLGVPNASAVYGGKDVGIDASALSVGAGGKIVLWSGGSTRFHGAIEADGGALSGDGGLVETSGQELNVLGATVNVGAPAGRAGIWLLDPNDVNIGGSSAGASKTASGNWQSAGTVTISASQISSTLSGGSNVDIQTSGNGSENGDITLESGCNITDSGSTPVTLTLNADRNITLNGNIEATGTVAGTLGVNLSAGQNAGDTSGSVSLVDSSVMTNGGAVNITANTGVSIDPNSLIWTQSNGSTGRNAGNITIQTTSTSGTSAAPSGTINIAGPLNSYGAPNYSNSTGGGMGGAVTISTAGPYASIDLTDSSPEAIDVHGGQGGNFTYLGNGGTGGTVNISTSGANSTIDVAGGIRVFGGLGMNSAGNGGAVSVKTTGPSGSTITVGQIDATGGSGWSGTGVAGGSVTISTSGSNSGISIKQIGVYGLISGEAGGTVDISASGTGSSVTTAGINAAGNGAANGNITISGAGISLGSALSGGDITMTSTGPVTQSAAISASGLDLEGAGGSYTLTNSGNAVGTLAANTGTVNFADGSALTVGTVGTRSGITATGDVTLTANSLTLGQAVTGTGNLTLEPLAASTTIGLESGAGSFSLTGAELNEIQPGFAGIIIGNAGGTGKITFGAGSGAGYTFNAPLILRNPGASSGGIVINDPLSVGAGTLILNTSGTVSQSASNGAITAGLLDLEGSGAFTLGANNAVSTLEGGTAGATGGISFTDNGGFAIGANGLNAGTGSVTLSSTGAVTENGALTAGTLDLEGSGGTFTLNNSGNNVSSLEGGTAGATGGISFTDNGGFAVGANGLNAGTGSVTLSSTGTVTENGALTAGTLDLEGSGGTFSLDSAGNSVGTLIANTYDAALDDSSALVLGASSLTGTLTISATSGISQSGAVTGSSLVAKTFYDAGGPIDLGNSGNHFGGIDLRTLNSAGSAYAAGNITYTDSGSVSVGYVSTLGTITINASGNITVSHVDPANVTITSTGGSINSDGSGLTINATGSVTLNAATGIGNTNTILTNTGNLIATTASGNADISNTGSVSADITAGGSIDISSGGDITVGTIDAQGGSASISASGSILGAAGNQLIAKDGAALSAANGTIGSASQPLDMDVSGGTVEAASTGQKFLSGTYALQGSDAAGGAMLGALPDYVSVNFNPQYINEFRSENGWLTGPAPYAGSASGSGKGKGKKEKTAGRTEALRTDKRADQ